MFCKSIWISLGSVSSSRKDVYVWVNLWAWKSKWKTFMIKSYTQFNLLNCKSFHSMLYSLRVLCTTTEQYMCVSVCVCVFEREILTEDICSEMQAAYIIPVNRMEYHSLQNVSSCRGINCIISLCTVTTGIGISTELYKTTHFVT